MVVVFSVLPIAGQSTPASADQFGIYINKRPLKDFSRDARKLIDSKKVDLGTAFKVTIKGSIDLAKDGKTYILKDPVLMPGGSTGDPAMQKLAHDAILAIGDAGWFGYLTAFDRENRQNRAVTIQAEQNETQFQAKIMAEQRDENTAKVIASGLRSLLMLASSQAQGDEAIFLKFTSADGKGKDLNITMAAPKDIIAGMIQRELAKQNNN